jgi:two-component sensor histidine kinase
LGFNHQDGRVRIQLSRGKGWDSIIKREGFGFNYQEEGMGFNHQEGRVGVPLERGKGWD